MYSIYFTEEEWSDIHFVGGRYAWSYALMRYCQQGKNDLHESEAWAIAEAMEEDTEGGHDYFPMLDGYSELREKLIRFLDSIV